MAEKKIKFLGDVPVLHSLTREQHLIAYAGGDLYKIPLEDLITSINADDYELLHEVAWGVQILQDVQSSQQWTHVGNQTMKEEFLSRCGRYLLTNSGKAAKLSVTNSGVFADGTPLDESLGHVMYIKPDRLYYRVVTDAKTGIPTIWWSLVPIGGHYIREDFAIGAYMGSLSGGALVSRSGMVPAGDKSIEAFWNAAQVNGKHFGLEDYDAQKYMIMLNLMKFANPNCQTNIGYGVGGSANKSLWSVAQSLLTGATKSLGDACGKIDISLANGAIVGENCSRVSLCGVEDKWNWMWEMAQNIFYGSANNAGQTGNEVFLYEGNRMPSAAELAGTPVGDFRQLTRLTSSGVISKMILGEYFDIIPSALGGGYTSYWGDHTYNNNTGQLALWGGEAGTGARAGLGFANLTGAWSDSASYFGSRLAYYGPIEYTSGAELVASV